VGDTRVIQKLPNGNFEVTPALIMKTWELAIEVRRLQLELKKCQEVKK